MTKKISYEKFVTEKHAEELALCRKKAEAYTMGFLDGLVKYFWVIIVVITAGSFLRPDPTDGGYFQRSGLHYFRDYGTGKEYISSDNGGLIERRK
jgi:hypothetical protein